MLCDLLEDLEANEQALRDQHGKGHVSRPPMLKPYLLKLSAYILDASADTGYVALWEACQAVSDEKELGDGSDNLSVGSDDQGPEYYGQDDGYAGEDYVEGYAGEDYDGLGGGSDDLCEGFDGAGGDRTLTYMQVSNRVMLQRCFVNAGSSVKL